MLESSLSIKEVACCCICRFAGTAIDAGCARAAGTLKAGACKDLGTGDIACCLSCLMHVMLRDNQQLRAEVRAQLYRKSLMALKT